MPKRSKQSRKFDVGIVTILREHELPAFNRIFKIDINKDKYPINGDTYYFSKVECGSNHIDVVIALAKDTGNEESKRITNKLVENFCPKEILLVGIGYGVRGKVELGDVVVSKSVVFIDKEKLKEGEVEHRWETENAPDSFLDEFRQFTEVDNRDKWYSYFWVAEGKLFLEKNINPIGYLHPKIHLGHIASGEKVVADGSPQKMLSTQGQIRAGDTEGWGFARALKNKNIKWLVIRGISDFGDPISKDGGQNKDKCHDSAANSAVSLAKTFLEYKYFDNANDIESISSEPQIEEDPWELFGEPIQLASLSSSVFWSKITDKNKTNLKLKIIIPSGKFETSTGQLPLVSDAMYLPEAIGDIANLLKGNELNLDVQTLFDIDVVKQKDKNITQHKDEDYQLDEESLSDSNLIITGTGDINLVTRLLFDRWLRDLAPGPRNPTSASINGRTKFYNDLVYPNLGCLSVIRSPFNDERIIILAYGIQAIGTMGALKLLHLFISGKANSMGNNRYDSKIAAKIINFPCIQYTIPILNHTDTTPSIELMNIDEERLMRGEGILE